MPVRRSTGRNGATPIRGATPANRQPRVGSADPSENGRATRQGRASSKVVDADTGVNNPRLPEIQTQQSFAYGSQKTPFLPDQLIARPGMTLQQMAQAVDAGIRQAKKNIKKQVAEAEANFGPATQDDPRTERAKRRSESKDDSSRGSRETSVDSQTTKGSTTKKTGGQTSPSPLPEITEGQSDDERATPSEKVDDRSRSPTGDASSFPSGNFDISYHQERGKFRPFAASPAWIDRICGPVEVVYRYIYRTLHLCSSASRSVFQFGKQTLHEAAAYTPRTSTVESLAFRLFHATALVLLACMVCLAASLLFCNIYTSRFCDFGTSSALQLALQRFCGSCSPAFRSPKNTTVDGHDLAAISRMLGNMDNRLGQIVSRFETKHSSLSSTLSQVLDRQHEMALTVSHLQQESSQGAGVSLSARTVNYCSPGTGAVIDPYLTSPTKQKQFSFFQKVLLTATGLQKYQSHPPTEALRSWEEIGDCWCAASSKDFAQIGVMMGHAIYPTEVVIEHIAPNATTSPLTAPKDIEIYGDFSHVDPTDFDEMELFYLPQGQLLPPAFLRIGKMTYDGTSAGAQSVRLSINQQVKRIPLQKIVFRATSNYGGDHTCFYRVRVHGSPVIPHPQITVDGKSVS